MFIWEAGTKLESISDIYEQKLLFTSNQLSK